MLAKFFAVLLLATTSVIASPFPLDKRGNIIVRYRRASKTQAADYNKHGAVTWDPTWKEHWGQQIGKGVYSCPTRDMYTLSTDQSWYCVLSVDEASFDKLDKAWIPRKDPSNKTLWNQNTETNLDNYIKSLDSSWNPDTTIRLSIMPNGKDMSAIQMCIPPALVEKVKFHAVCKEKKNEVKDDHVDYSKWKNVKGKKE
ncbi:hypothetical protein VPNG_03521 [Cytospora leucostoma]|uniref:Uncharacterized protein n=1 Tax=Cytospora leucostoma TaxID=1230097 RepID=A0A423XCP8_9PEZI|nr:hypothetical protein VPNG_03521 [Cytospora leucostoma]